MYELYILKTLFNPSVSLLHKIKTVYKKLTLFGYKPYIYTHLNNKSLKQCIE